MDKLTYGIVGVVLALVIGSLATAAILGSRTSPPGLATPDGVVLAYATAEQRGDAQAAWNLLHGSTQARGDRDRFLAAAGGRSNSRAYLNVEEPRISGDEASVVLVQTYAGSGALFGGGGSANRSTVRLAKSGDDWRITVPPDNYLFDTAGRR